MLIQITAPYMCGGLVIKDDLVIDAAPILEWTIGKSWIYVRQWVEKKGYKWEEVR